MCNTYKKLHVGLSWSVRCSSCKFTDEESLQLCPFILKIDIPVLEMTFFKWLFQKVVMRTYDMIPFGPKVCIVPTDMNPIPIINFLNDFADFLKSYMKQSRNH